MGTFKELVNLLFDLGLFVNAVLFIPQAIKIFYNKSAVGLSLITFGGYNIIQILILLHGYFHHDLQLMYGMLASLITCGAVTIGILIFRKPHGNN